MLKFVDCISIYHGSEKTVWMNLDFVRYFVEAPEQVFAGQGSSGAPKYRDGDPVLFLNVPGDDAEYFIRDAARIKEVKDFLARSLEGR